VQLKSIKLKNGEAIDLYLYCVYKIIDELQLHLQWRLPPGVVAGCILEGLLVEYDEAKRHFENTLDCTTSLPS